MNLGLFVVAAANLALLELSRPFDNKFLSYRCYSAADKRERERERAC